MNLSESIADAIMIKSVTTAGRLTRSDVVEAVDGVMRTYRDAIDVIYGDVVAAASAQLVHPEVRDACLLSSAPLFWPRPWVSQNEHQRPRET